jgi:hypothetical protein
MRRGWSQLHWLARSGWGAGEAGVAAAAQLSSTSGGNAVDLKVMVQPTATAPGASFTDTITVANERQDPAHDVAITVPFDASAVQLLGVQFNQSGAWVTSATPNGFHADLGRIGSHGQEVQVIASFAERPGYTPSNTLLSSIAYSYSDNGKTHSGTTNTELLPIAAAPVALPTPASMVVMAGGTVQINSAIFAPGEAVAFWYNTPSGQALPLYIRNGQITTERRHQETLASGATQELNNGHFLIADAQGAIAAMLSTKDLQPGAYTLVAHGLSSDATAVVAFQVQ